MSIEFMYAHFEDKTGAGIDCNVLADGQAEGPTNKLIMIDAGSYKISLDTKQAYQPQNVVVSLDGTTQLRPKIVVFTLV